MTLRRNSLHSFIDTLILATPRREKLAKVPSKQYKKRDYRGIHEYPPSEFRFGELVLFHPIEIGIGLHQDLRNLHVSFVSNTSSSEERAFHLRSFHFPF